MRLNESQGRRTVSTVAYMQKNVPTQCNTVRSIGTCKDNNTMSNTSMHA